MQPQAPHLSRSSSMITERYLDWVQARTSAATTKQEKPNSQFQETQRHFQARPPIPFGPVCNCEQSNRNWEKGFLENV